MKNPPQTAYRLRRVVPVVGLEPTRYRYQRILSPSRLPFHHFGKKFENKYTTEREKVQEQSGPAARPFAPRAAQGEESHGNRYAEPEAGVSRGRARL